MNTTPLALLCAWSRGRGQRTNILALHVTQQNSSLTVSDSIVACLTTGHDRLPHFYGLRLRNTEPNECLSHKTALAMLFKLLLTPVQCSLTLQPVSKTNQTLETV